MIAPRSRTRPSSAPSQRSSASIAVPAAALSAARKSLAFGVMCLGFFIALASFGGSFCVPPFFDLTLRPPIAA